MLQRIFENFVGTALAIVAVRVGWFICTKEWR